MSQFENNLPQSAGIAGGRLVVHDGMEFLCSEQPETVDDVIEGIVAWLRSELDPGEFVAAKDEFFARFGKVFPEDDCWDPRMSYYLDWFLFARSLPGQDLATTPFQTFCNAKLTVAIPEKNRVLLEALSVCRHSVFQVSKVRDDMMIVTDLIGQSQKITVRPKAGETFKAFLAKDVFQGFLFGSGDAVFLSQGLIVHPRSATKVVLKMIKSAQKVPGFQASAILTRLANLQLRALRHAHVDAKTIYSA